MLLVFEPDCGRAFSRAKYQEVKDEWWGVPEVFERQDVIEVRCTIHSIFVR